MPGVPGMPGPKGPPGPPGPSGAAVPLALQNEPTTAPEANGKSEPALAPGDRAACVLMAGLAHVPSMLPPHPRGRHGALLSHRRV